MKVNFKLTQVLNILVYFLRLESVDGVQSERGGLYYNGHCLTPALLYAYDTSIS